MLLEIQKTEVRKWKEMPEEMSDEKLNNSNKVT